MEMYKDAVEPQSFVQKAQSVADSAVSYCMGGGLAWFSCTANQLNPILQTVGLVVGILIALAKGYYDWKKHAKKMKSPVNDR